MTFTGSQNWKSWAGFRQRTGAFWQRVTEGIELHVLWGQFMSEARQSYGLYSSEVDWESLKRETPWKRGLKLARLLFWAMILKLSPARRVFLLLALAFVVLAFLRIIGWPLAILSLLFLLGLELSDRVTMKRDLEIAREIQSWLVPEVPPQIQGLDIAFATRPQNTVAGDYYDAFLRQNRVPATEPPAQSVEASAADDLLLVVADVAGKSVPAALLMATFQASLRTLAAAPTSLTDLVLGLNRYASAHSLRGLRFTTAFVGEMDPATRLLRYINAGHNPPILRRASGTIERLEAGGLPLGIRAEAQYESASTALGPGDLLLIFTDGLVEAMNQNNDEYGEWRLLEALAQKREGGAAERLRYLMNSVDSFVGGARQHDDITCLVLQVEPRAAGS
jgi:phosphoserine phosphatase RsbU/P